MSCREDGLDEVAETRTHIPASEHRITPDQLCPRALGIVKKLQKAGYEAYLVGGCVRDLLLDVEPKDFDIATSAHPEEIKKLFSSCRLIGRRFRLAHIHFGRDYLEVATFRAPHHEGSEKGQGVVNADGRIIHDNVYGTVEQDVWRRDFSVNALFYDPSSGDVIDFVGAMDDLEKRQLRLIGEAEQRYREDPVRMLRAIRFAAKLDFDIVGESHDLIEPMGELLGAVAPARLFDEMLKLLHSGNGWQTFETLQSFGLLEHLLPLTVESLENDEDGGFAKLVEASLKNTDRRVREGLSVMPPFLYAVLLWDQVSFQAEHQRENGQPEMQALHLAATDVLRDQVKSTAIPRRFSNVTREIWALQSRFRHRDWRRANALLQNKRFRAAYDFLCLRAQSGEPVEEDCAWWTEFQECPPDDRQGMCTKPRRGSRNKRRRGRPRGA